MSWSPSAAWRFVAGGVLAFAAAYTISEAADPVYPELRARMALYHERSPALEAVAVGNSHGATLEFRELGMRGMHLSMAGQDPFEASYLARYAAETSRLKYVLFAASYGLQRRDHSVVGSTDLRARRRQLYARTPLQRPIEGDLEQWAAGMVSPVVRDDHWKGVFGRPIKQRPPIRLSEEGRGIGPEPPRLGRDSLDRYGAFVAGQHRTVGEETMEIAPETPARVARRLDALARELRARGVTLVLYTPPYHVSYLRVQEPVVNAETRAIMTRLAADHPNVVWLDYSADPRFAERDELFTNSDHLNRVGGRAFSLLLRDCLRTTRLGTAAATRSDGCPASTAPVASARPHAPIAAAPTNSRNAAEEPQ
jgi:hypothetical protein